MAKDYQPRMHSAEHMLNSAMDRKFNCGRCFSAHINKKKSKCDYKYKRGMTDEEAREIEMTVNAAISAKLPVTDDLITLEEAEEKYNLERLPDGVDGVRVIKIGDFDTCPCIGEHVDNTSEIGEFKMVSHSFEDGVLRIRYKLGEA
ncbi:Threonyl and Alanyl tRNA synthetase second additional domain-containing protein [Maridesulfovibrio ferrireducens]|uniref:Threonyl and Alanyl tRNA synthetase second additional domain-containing protein n=1 Tax=Maridesulfovibrio ferrireducens TaxID=246191 RepID=A0A1G9HAL2_9BACT|nr:hypothetical protein [Maridesulfovibrio ferrireducens]SDL09503.1 Threonyl and Alanyl tRNA synthetase second additional domain-containing protein [Maridesulfovibrio ferrireducens]